MVSDRTAAYLRGFDFDEFVSTDDYDFASLCAADDESVQEIKDYFKPLLIGQNVIFGVVGSYLCLRKIGSEPINGYEHISVLKARRCAEVDRKTQDILSGGFTFDGELFSSSIPAQINWSLMQQGASLGIVRFPKEITTQDDKKYSLTAEKVMGFYIAFGTLIETGLKGGRDLKEQINAASTKSEVDAVVDSR